MAEVRERDRRAEPSAEGAAPAVGASPEAQRAKAFFLTGLAWAAVVLVSWLAWWLLGEGGREALARTVGLSAAELTPYVLAALVAEKLAAKALLFAALYHWLRSRSPSPARRATGAETG